MKIAFVVNVFPTLSETFILNQITGLVERGVEIDIIAGGVGGASKIHPDVIKYNLLDRTIYLDQIEKRIPRSKSRRALQALCLFFKHFRKKPNAILKSLNVFKLGKKALNMEAFFRTLFFINKGPYDIIHCHFGPNGYLAFYLKDIGAIHGKVVTTFYGYDISTYVKQNGERAYTSLFKRGDLFISICEDMRNRLIRLGCNKEKAVILRLGVDMDRFRCNRRKNDNGHIIRLLSVGRLVEKKGFEYSIRAVAKIVRQYPRIEYKIIGDGHLKNDIVSLIQELNVAAYVKLLGWCTQDEVETIMAESDIFLAPSVTARDGDREGTPTVLIEASARCLPVISTQHAGIPEVVQDGKSGFLVPEKDVSALTEKLQYLIENPVIWSELGQAGRRHVIESYDKNKINDQLLKIYELVNSVEASLKKSVAN